MRNPATSGGRQGRVDFNWVGRNVLARYSAGERNGEEEVYSWSSFPGPLNISLTVVSRTVAITTGITYGVKTHYSVFSAGVARARFHGARTCSDCHNFAPDEARTLKRGGGNGMPRG